MATRVFLARHGATVLCCTPTYALHLAQVARTERLDLGRGAVRKIIVAGEPGGSQAALRRRIDRRIEPRGVCQAAEHYTIRLRRRRRRSSAICAAMFLNPSRSMRKR